MWLLDMLMELYTRSWYPTNSNTSTSSSTAVLTSWHNPLPLQGNTNVSVDDIEVYTNIQQKPATAKPRVVVLGSGWAAASFIKALPKNIA
jgi:hypothetical protein